MMPALLFLASVAAGLIPSSQFLGTAEGMCRASEPGPSIQISAIGLKDRTGVLRAELYPADQADFLADDNVLVTAGKTFRRVVAPVPATGPARLCVRVPGPGTYTLALTHDRDGKAKFNFWRDGIGFAGNPKLGLSAPPASAARITAGAGTTQASIVLNYRVGLLGFRPLN